MAEKTIKTKILLRYDVLSAWTQANPTLQKGEVAIVAIPTDSKELNINGTTPPQILFKVGPGEFDKLPYASGKAADVYSWAKEASLSIEKVGEGNVVSGIEWDAKANDGKGGIKFTTASVATSEELKGVQDRLTVIEGTGAKSRITLLEEGLAATDKLIADSKDAWAANTTYSFSQNGKSFTVTPSEGEGKTITFDYLTAKEVADAITAYGYKDEAGVKAIVESYKYTTIESLNNYYTKEEIDNKGFKDESGVKTIVEGYGYQTSTQVENAITSKGYQTASDVETAITSKGYQTADNVNSLIANSTLAGTVADLSEDVATNAGDIKDLGDELDGHIANKENPHGVTAAQINAYTKEETNALFEPYRTSADQDVIDKAIKDDIAGLKSNVGNLSGAFQFKGTAASIEALGKATAENAGHVYIIGSKEYASDGSSWILLGDEGSYVLKTTYEAHLGTQEAVDKGQSDKIAAIEKDIADNRADWAKKTSVTDPTAGDGKILVDGNEMVVYALPEDVVQDPNYKHITVTETSVSDGTTTFKKYDDTALAGRVSTVEGKVKALEEKPFDEYATKAEVDVERKRIDSIVNTTIPGINNTIKTLATKEEVEDAIADSHTHSNKSILDATTESFTTALKEKYDGYEGSISGVAGRVTAVENEFTTVDGAKGRVVELEGAVDTLKGKVDTLSVTETSVSYNGVTFNKYDDKALSDRVKVVEDNFADWAIIWDCGGASNN